jgi:PEP-CTERM motif
MSFRLKFTGCLLAACALSFTGLAAVTATCDAATFDVSGNFATGTLGGTINIDVITGAVTSADVTALGTSPAVTGPFTTIDNLVEYPPSDHLLYISFSDSMSSASDVLVLFLPTSTLIDYFGGSMCSTMYSCSLSAQSYLEPGGLPEFQSLTFGSLSVPEPSAWAMLLLGFAGFGLLGSRGKQKAQALATIPANGKAASRRLCEKVGAPGFPGLSPEHPGPGIDAAPHARHARNV